MRKSITVSIASLLLVSCSGTQNVATDHSVPPPSPAVEVEVPKPKLEPVKAETIGDSVYTEISEKECKEKEPEADSGAIYQSECPGVAGYKLVFSASDHSQVLSVIDPQGKETLFPFRYVLNTVADFVMGDKIEWRMDGKGGSAKPKAMIVRLTKAIDPEDRDKTESFLAVADLRGEPCVTDLIPPSADQNTKARQIADTGGRECMKFAEH